MASVRQSTFRHWELRNLLRFFETMRDGFEYSVLRRHSKRVGEALYQRAFVWSEV